MVRSCICSQWFSDLRHLALLGNIVEFYHLDFRNLWSKKRSNFECQHRSPFSCSHWNCRLFYLGKFCFLFIDGLYMDALVRFDFCSRWNFIEESKFNNETTRTKSTFRFGSFHHVDYFDCSSSCSIHYSLCQEPHTNSSRSINICLFLFFCLSSYFHWMCRRKWILNFCIEIIDPSRSFYTVDR